MMTDKRIRCRSISHGHRCKEMAGHRGDHAAYCGSGPYLCTWKRDRRGFAVMGKTLRTRIARMGGVAVQASGSAYILTSAEARRGGRLRAEAGRRNAAGRFVKA